jgi:tetratricopeptide (TPR) repeat protein
VRRYIAECLKFRAESHLCKCCRSNDAFQIAFCYKTGFGVERSEEQALIWLEKSERTDIEDEIELARSERGRLYWNDRIDSLIGGGHLTVLDYSTEYRKTKSLEISETEYIREIRDMEKALGEGHTIVFVLKDILASIYHDSGDFKRSEELRTELWAELDSDSLYGPEHRVTLDALGNLCAELHYQGKHQEAEKRGRQALEGSERVLGMEHPFTMTTANILAAALQYQGKYQEAETMERRVLEGREKSLGKEHHSTLVTVSNLALLLRDQGKYPEAEEMNQRALEGRKRVLGKGHPDTLGSLLNQVAIFES